MTTREVRPGGTILVEALGFTEATYGDPTGVRLLDPAAAAPGNVVIGPITTGFVEASEDNWAYDFLIPADLAPGDYAAEWEFNGAWYRDEDLISVVVLPGGAFASATDVSGWLGRELTSGEEEKYTALTEAATTAIVAAAGRDDNWAPDPIPRILTMLCTQIALRAGSNPESIASESKQLGQYQHSRTYPRGMESALALTREEELLVRRVVNGSNTATTRPDSAVTENFDSPGMPGGLEWLGSLSSSPSSEDLTE